MPLIPVPSLVDVSKKLTAYLTFFALPGPGGDAYKLSM